MTLVTEKVIDDILDKNTKFRKYVYLSLGDSRKLFGPIGTTIFVKELVGEFGIAFEDPAWRAIEFGLENCVLRGNKGLNLILTAKVLETACFYIVRLRDSGLRDDEIFNWREMIQKYRTGQVYFEYKGNGTKALDQPGFEAFYEDDGSILNLQIPKRHIVHRIIIYVYNIMMYNVRVIFLKCILWINIDKNSLLSI